MAEKFGVSRQSVHAWMTRYEQGGIGALADRSDRPRYSSLQVSAVVETRVVELRRQHPTWGHIRIQHQLTREATAPLPSASAVYRLLVRHGLVEPKATRTKLAYYKRWERARPMELWQMDVVGAPCSPSHNAVCERFHETILQKWWRPAFHRRYFTSAPSEELTRLCPTGSP
jgi:transposase